MACLFHDEPVPKSIDPRRYREFFAHHLEVGAKPGTLRWSQLKDPVIPPIAPNESLPTPRTTKQQEPSENKFTFTFKATYGGKDLVFQSDEDDHTSHHEALPQKQFATQKAKDTSTPDTGRFNSRPTRKSTTSLSFQFRSCDDPKESSVTDRPRRRRLLTRRTRSINPWLKKDIEIRAEALNRRS